MSSHLALPALVLALVSAPAIANAQQSAPRPQADGIGPFHSSLDAFFGRRSLLPTRADTVVSQATRSTCPMLVARPDTTRLERMPRAHVDTAAMAPMPVARGCVAGSK
ncbi:MAG TPA: hypothetical protein VJW73_17625 [Gemmatimonadaceae bacterium]|nr:hypothetical protein [Gemmatimonadaceae bacterium]